MATLKILGFNGNVIWLTDVTKVQTFLYMDSSNTYKHGSWTTAWQALDDAIEQTKDDYLRNKIKDCLTGYKNFDTAVESTVGLPTSMVFIQVNFKNSEPENWLVVQNQNYLMTDTGNNIDRI